MSRKSRDAQTVSQITPAAGGDARDVDPADGHPFAEPTPMEAARRLEAAQEGEPFGAVIDELLELHRGASRATRFVFLDGPDGVGIPRIAERLAERAPSALVQGVLDGRAYSGLEAIVPELLARARRLPVRALSSEAAFGCAGGCCRLWFDHTRTDAPIPAWSELAAGRASFFEGMAELLAELTPHQPAAIWLWGMELLDPQTAGLIEYLLDDSRLGGQRGSLWIAQLPPADQRSERIERLLEHPSTHRITVGAMGYDELRAHLARPDVVRALLERTGGLVEAVDALLRGEPRPSAIPTRPPRRHAAEVNRETTVDEVMREASLLAHRHSLDEAATLLERAAARTSEPHAVLLETLSDLHATRGSVADALNAAERLRAARAGDVDATIRVGRLARAAGQLSRAEEALLDVADAAPARSRAVALLELALVRLERAEYEDAKALARRAMTIDAEPETVMEARNTLGRASWSVGDWEFAEQCFLENEATAKQSDDALFEMRSLNNLALIHMARGRLGDARGLLHRVVQLASRRGGALYRAIALENIGVVDRLQGRYAEAITSYRAAARVLNAYEDRGLLVRVTTNLAEVLATVGASSRAREVLRFAVGEQADADRPERRADRLAIEADVAEQSGDRGEASRLCREVRALAEATGYRRTVVLATLRLARYAYLDGDTDKARELIEDLEPDSTRNACRLALLQASLETDANQVVRKARYATTLAREGGDPLLELRSLTRLSRALLDSGARTEAELRYAEAEAVSRRLELATPPELREGFRMLESVLELQRIGLELGEERAEERNGRPTTGLDRLIGSSASIERVRAWARRVGPTNATVLLTGESGTGKELVASALHDLSTRRDHTFVTVNCGAIVETLLLSELFGHEQGSFTGASKRKEGRFEQANGGTLFLDEVGEMSTATQSALLRVLQERAFQRVGGTETLTVDVRIIAATNRDLEQMVAQGSFRADLYYRLRALHLHLPSLRERPGDIETIATAILNRHASGAPAMLDDDAREMLRNYPWPGNVRELENVLRAVTVLSTSRVIGREEVERYAPAVAGGPTSQHPVALPDLYYAALQQRGSIYEMRKDLERAAVERALQETKGNISRAASLLGMKRPRLSQLASEYGLKKNGRES